MEDATPDAVTRLCPACSVGTADPLVVQELPDRLASGVCEDRTVPVAPVNVSQTSVSPVVTVIVAVAVFPLVSVAVIVAAPNPYPTTAMLPPVVAASVATLGFDVVQLNVAEATNDPSNRARPPRVFASSRDSASRYRASC